MNIEQKNTLIRQAKGAGFDDPVKLGGELEQRADAARWEAWPNSAGAWVSALGSVSMIPGPQSADAAFRFMLRGPWLRIPSSTLHEQCRDDLESVQDAAAELERRAAQARLALDGKL